MTQQEAYVAMYSGGQETKEFLKKELDKALSSGVLWEDIRIQFVNSEKHYSYMITYPETVDIPEESTYTNQEYSSVSPDYYCSIDPNCSEQIVLNFKLEK